ncbi:carbohydrate kinase [Okibacterium endophyticum]
MTSAPGKVAVVGDALIDELRDASGSREFVGGAGLNVAVGLARLGVPATLVAMVGDDADGERIRAMLAEHGVELVANTGPHGTSRATSDRADGEPRYTFNQAARNRKIAFDAAQREALATAGLVVVSCFPFDDAEQAATLEAAVSDPRSRLVIDPNPRAGMMRDSAEFVRGFERLAAVSMVVKVGDEDAEMLYGESLHALRDRLLAGGAGSVLATAGRDGASFASSSVTVSAPIATLPGAVVDTMGAGDATLASTVQHVFAHGVPADEDAARGLLERAMLIAAATCRAEGALLRLPPAD